MPHGLRRPLLRVNGDVPGSGGIRELEVWCRPWKKRLLRASWTRSDVRRYLWSHTTNTFDDISFQGRYGKIYNRNLPRWYRREPGARIPIVPSPDDIHLFVAGGEAGRFSAFLPGWGHMTSPVLRAVNGKSPERDVRCTDGTCEL